MDTHITSDLHNFISAVSDYSVRYNKQFERYYSDLYKGNKLEDKSKLHAIYHYILESKNTFRSKKIRLNTLHDLLLEQNIGVHTSYHHFSRLLSKMQKPGFSIESVLRNSSKGKVRGSRFCIELIEKAEVLYVENPMWKYPKLLQEVNIYANTIGLEEISIDHIKRYFRQHHVQQRLRCVRNGEDYFLSNVGHMNHLKVPEYSGRQLEIDGTRLQIPFYNTEKKDVDFLVIFCIMDVTSRKILGYSVGKSENSNLVVNAFKRFLQQYDFLPTHIIRDNSTAYQKDFKFIEQYLTLKGVQWEARSTPRSCAHIGNFQKAFAQSICSSIESYIGLGIRTKDIDSRLNAKQLKTRIRDKKESLLKENELIFQVDELIIQYNSHSFQGRKCANELFNERFKLRKVIKVTEADKALLNGLRKIKPIKNSEIEIRVKNKSNFYKLDYNISEQMSKVIVAYHEDDMSCAYIFDSEYKFVDKVTRDEYISSLPEERSNKELQNLISIIKKRKRKYNSYKQDINDKKQRAFDRLDKIIPLYDYNADKSKEEQVRFQNEISRKFINNGQVNKREGESEERNNDPYFSIDISKIKNLI